MHSLMPGLSFNPDLLDCVLEAFVLHADGRVEVRVGGLAEEAEVALFRDVVEVSATPDWGAAFAFRAEALCILSRILLGDVAEHQAGGARVCFRPSAATRYLNCAELLLHGHLDVPTLRSEDPEVIGAALRRAFARVLGGGAFRELCFTDIGNPLDVLRSAGFWGAAASPATLGVLCEHGVDYEEVRRAPAHRRRLAQAEYERNTFGPLVRRIGVLARERSIRFEDKWGWAGDPWNQGACAVLAQRDVVVAAHHLPTREMYHSRKFVMADGIVETADILHVPPRVDPAIFLLETPGSAWQSAAAHVTGADLWTRLRHDGILQLDFRACHSRTVCEWWAAEEPLSTRLQLVGRPTYQSLLSIYRGIEELLAAQLARTATADMNFDYLGSGIPFPTAVQCAHLAVYATALADHKRRSTDHAADH